MYHFPKQKQFDVVVSSSSVAGHFQLNKFSPEKQKQYTHTQKQRTCVKHRQLCAKDQIVYCSFASDNNIKEMLTKEENI